MRLKELAAKFKEDLASLYEADEIQAIFFLSIAHYVNINRQAYLLNSELEIDPIKLGALIEVLSKLQASKPIQYILGVTIFYGLPFNVNESVLIPRTETEELVHWVIEIAKDAAITGVEPQAFNMLDIGTGSGCIAISLKKNLPRANVHAVDISRNALATAQQNALLNGVDVSFFERDILQAPNAALETQYSIMISNPPYITQTEKEQMHENVLANEPHSALFVTNEQPLIFYEAIADCALVNLVRGGLLFFEINEYLGDEMVELLSDKGFTNIILRKDMQGKDRMICCTKTGDDTA
jgi:release factor glutamine methyltransferase